MQEILDIYSKDGKYLGTREVDNETRETIDVIKM